MQNYSANSIIETQQHLKWGPKNQSFHFKILLPKHPHWLHQSAAFKVTKHLIVLRSGLKYLCYSWACPCKNINWHSVQRLLCGTNELRSEYLRTTASKRAALASPAAHTETLWSNSHQDKHLCLFKEQSLTHKDWPLLPNLHNEEFKYCTESLFLHRFIWEM